MIEQMFFFPVVRKEKGASGPLSPLGFLYMLLSVIITKGTFKKVIFRYFEKFVFVLYLSLLIMIIYIRLLVFVVLFIMSFNMHST